MNGTNRRLVFVDALRGYALMGLFLIHMVEYFELYWLHPEPGSVNTLMFALVGGKAYAIFALLFGLSFYIILDGQAARGVVLWMLLVAAAHAWMRRFHYGPLEWLLRSLTLTDASVPLVRRVDA